jgi:hypothetical protein
MGSTLKMGSIYMSVWGALYTAFQSSQNQANNAITAIQPIVSKTPNATPTFIAQTVNAFVYYYLIFKSKKPSTPPPGILASQSGGRKKKTRRRSRRRN